MQVASSSPLVDAPVWILAASTALTWLISVYTLQSDFEERMNELRQMEDQAKKAMTDAARIADELRQEQEHAGQIDKLRRALEVQVKELQVRVDEAEAAALHGGRKTIQALEQRVRRILSSIHICSMLFSNFWFITNYRF